MKKTLLAAALLSTTILGGALATTTAHAEDPTTPEPVSKSLSSQGSVKFYTDLGGFDPVDPGDPGHTTNPGTTDPDIDDPTPQPGTDGPLSLDYVPDLYFGLNKVSTSDQTYDSYALGLYEDGYDKPATKPAAIYAQVSDVRGTLAGGTYGGWTLSVAQKDKFTTEDQKMNLGDATQISFKDQKAKSNWVDATAPSVMATDGITLLPNNESQTVFAAKANEGEGTWLSVWGDVSQEQRDTLKDPTDPASDIVQAEANVDKSVTLSVPGNVKKAAVRYATTLDWTLTDTPAEVTPGA